MLIKNQDFDNQPKIAILLCTMQGVNYLSEQIDSIVGQLYKYWAVWASDDGSNDGTLSVLDRYEKKLGPEKLSIIKGPCAGHVANFLSLTCREDIKADYFAYADQDDIWEADKLTRALECLQSISKNTPALYCSRTRYVDAFNREIGLSRLYKRQPNFRNALVQNIGGGNTMVFNEAARKLLCVAGSNVDVVSHDWWVYLVVSGCGGKVIFDPIASVRYRQHDGNLIGGDSSLIAGFERAKMVAGGRNRSWNDSNLTALRSIKSLLTQENQKIYDEFSESRSKGMYSRLQGLIRSGVYRQTWFGNFYLIAASIFNKL